MCHDLIFVFWFLCHSFPKLPILQKFILLFLYLFTSCVSITQRTSILYVSNVFSDEQKRTTRWHKELLNDISLWAHIIELFVFAAYYPRVFILLVIARVQSRHFKRLRDAVSAISNFSRCSQL